MSAHALALEWSFDGSLGVAFLVLLLAAGVAYLMAAAVGGRRDRRGRRWPRRRTVSYLAGLLVLAVDLYSGIGTEADTHLSVHMVEHMVMWVLVAPLLAGGAPVRLAFFALASDGRHHLARALHSRAVSALTGAVGSVCVFTAVVLITHLPAVYALALGNAYAHAAEHGLYLASAVLVWAPLLGVDPLPRRATPRGRVGCMLACMVPMVLIGAWLGTAPAPVYAHYLGPGALHDQRVAAAIMWLGCLPAFALLPALPRLRPAAGRRMEPRVALRDERVAGAAADLLYGRPRA